MGDKSSSNFARRRLRSKSGDNDRSLLIRDLQEKGGGSRSRFKSRSCGPVVGDEGLGEKGGGYGCAYWGGCRWRGWSHALGTGVGDEKNWSHVLGRASVDKEGLVARVEKAPATKKEWSRALGRRRRRRGSGHQRGMTPRIFAVFWLYGTAVAGCMGLLWGCYEAAMGNAMGLLWVCYGSAMGLPRGCYGPVMGLIRACHGTAMGLL